jgi:hypothetical protein
MGKKLSTTIEEAKELVQKISRKLSLKPRVSLELIKDVGVLEEVPEETKKWGVFLVPSKFQENFAPIYVLDSFFRNKTHWTRLLAHECGHIKTFYDGLPYFYLRGIEEPPGVLRKIPIALDAFSNQFAKYRDLGDFYTVAQLQIFRDFRGRLHDDIANKEAIKATFIDEYAIFADYELKNFLDLKFIKQPYISKLILMDLSEKYVLFDNQNESKCKDVSRKFDEFFKVLGKFELTEYVENCKKFFAKLEFTTDVNQMKMYYKSGLALLTQYVSVFELKQYFKCNLPGFM